MRIACLIAAALLLGVISPAAAAAPIPYTFDWTATNIRDSNGVPPPVIPGAASGSFTIVLDTLDTGFLPTDAPLVASTSFTNDAGATFSAANMGYTVAANGGNQRLVSVGGLLNGADTLIGLSNDFRLQFFVDIGGSVPVATPAAFGFFYFNAGPIGGGYTSPLDIALSGGGSTPVPLPATLGLLAVGVLVSGSMAHRRRTGARQVAA